MGKTINEEYIFEQEAIFLKGALGVNDDPLWFARKFYVLKASAALYQYAKAKLLPYSDGVQRLYNTIAEAEAKCVSNRGDKIYVLPGHTESVSTIITLDVAGLTIIGIGHGTDRPNLTQATTGTSAVFTISAANIGIKNIYFTGSATGTNERFIINTAAKTSSYLTVEDCVFEQKSKNLHAIGMSPHDTDSTICDYWTFKNCTWLGTAAGPDSAIYIKSLTYPASYLTIEECIFNYALSVGCDDGVIYVSMSSGVSGVLAMKFRKNSVEGLADGEQVICVTGAGTSKTGYVLDNDLFVADGTDTFLANVTGAFSFIGNRKAQPGTRFGHANNVPVVSTPWI